MNEPSSRNWKQAGLVGGIVAASLILLAFIANAVGIIQFGDPRRDDGDLGGAEPSAIITAAEPSGAQSSPSDTTAAAGEDTWVPVYEHELMKLDNSTAGTDSCRLLLIDFDSMDDSRFVLADPLGSDTSTEDTDLVWDACTGFAENEVTLYANGTGRGPNFAEGRTGFDAQHCHAETDSFPFELSSSFDPMRSYVPWLGKTGAPVLCMVTSEEQVALGELTEIPSTPEDSTGFSAVFEVSLWTRA